ncbi:putative L-asparaginase [Trichoderma guizhouense]|uniref:Putative L-asparaginase n=1 Tax=Trichoderma guizhouense TaxID=1491466 RepID=A0A1T3CI75_9HYPO|nr:putative L-asparaginase [Trichoderma guizhouense]
MDKEQQTRDEESRQGLLQDQECEEFELNDNSQDSTSSSSSRYDHESKKNQPDDKGPRYHLSSSRLALLVIAILMSNFSAAVDTGLSASTHTAVASAFRHTNLSSWPVNSFVVASMTVQPLYGRASDIVGRKAPYCIASALFAAGIVLSSFALNWEMLILARALCGLGSAGVTTMGSVVLTDAVGLANRGYYQSINYAVYGGGAALGSAFGGAIVQQLGWDWVYKTQIPISSLSLVLLCCLIPAQHGTVKQNSGQSRLQAIFREFDWRGSACLMLTLICLFVFLTLGGNVYPWTHSLILIIGLLTLVLAAAFVFVERHAVRPVLPLYLLIQFPACNIMVTGFLTSFINYSVLFNTTLFFQTVHLDSGQDAGFRLLVPSISFTVASCATGFIIARRGSPELTLQLGQGFLFVGTLGLVLMAAMFRTLSMPGWLYNIMLIFPIVGVGILASSTVLALLNVTPSRDQAVANGGLIMLRSLGIFISTAFSTTVLQNIFLASINLDQYDEQQKKKLFVKRQENYFPLKNP